MGCERIIAHFALCRNSRLVV